MRARRRPRWDGLSSPEPSLPSPPPSPPPPIPSSPPPPPIDPPPREVISFTRCFSPQRRGPLSQARATSDSSPHSHRHRPLLELYRLSPIVDGEGVISVPSAADASRPSPIASAGDSSATARRSTPPSFHRAATMQSSGLPWRRHFGGMMEHSVRSAHGIAAAESCWRTGEGKEEPQPRR